MQREECLAFCARRGFTVIDVYDETKSGAKKRPVWDRVREHARAGKFDVVVVWALDRVGRSMHQTVCDVLELTHQGVELFSVREAFTDLPPELRSLVLSVFAWVAEQERTRIRERTLAGQAAARGRGVQFGRPCTAIDLRRAAELRARGASFAETAAHLSVPKSTLIRALSDRERSRSGLPRPARK